MLKFIATILAFTTPVMGRLTDSEYAKFRVKNYVTNPGAENGKAGVTASAGSFTIDSSTPLDGSQSFVWDAAADGDTLRWDAITIPEGLKGRWCSVEMDYSFSGTSGDLTLHAYDGSNNLSSQDIDPDQSEAIVIFTCPSSGSITPSLEANADPASIKVDNIHFGRPTKLNNTSNSDLFGTFTYDSASNCEWSTTSASYASFSADSDCNSTSSTGQLSAPSSEIPGFSIASMPPGIYTIRAYAPFFVDNASNDTQCNFRLNDSDNGRVGSFVNIRDTVASGVRAQGPLEATVTVNNTRSNVTFDIQGTRQLGSANCDIDNRTTSDEHNVFFVVERFPLDSQKSISFDSGVKHVTARWETASNCVWSGTSTSQASFAADSDCSDPTVSGPGQAPGTKIPAVTINNIKANERYLVMFNGTFRNTSGAQTCDYYITDGTTTFGSSGMIANNSNTSGTSTVVGIVEYDTNQSNVTFELEYQASSNSCEVIADTANRSLQFSAINLDRSITNVNFEGMVKAQGATSTVKHLDATITTTTPTIEVEVGDWIDTASNVTTGEIDITINSGVCTSTPSCVVTPADSNLCSVRYDHANSTSTLINSIESFNCAGTPSQVDGTIGVSCTCE